MIYASEYEKSLYDKPIAATKRSNRVDNIIATASEMADRVGAEFVPDERKISAYVDTAPCEMPPQEWHPTIGQPTAANSNVQYNALDPATYADYTTLRTILDAAFNHAATGKGKERHARGLPFDRQPMLETTRLVGPGFPLGQAIKKSQEASGMISREEYDAAEAECLGAINYLAGAVAWMREAKAAQTNVGAAV